MKDYGSDPIGNGMFRMVPSGDIVNREERDKRLPKKSMAPLNGAFGMTWDELEKRQGGKLTRPKL